MSWGSNDLGSNAGNQGSGGGWSSQDWASIIGSGAKGASDSLQGLAQMASTKREAREAKRRTLAKLYQNALRRNMNAFKQNQEHTGEMRDFQSDQLKDIARGFVGSLSGSTGRTRNV